MGNTEGGAATSTAATKGKIDKAAEKAKAALAKQKEKEKLAAEKAKAKEKAEKDKAKAAAAVKKAKEKEAKAIETAKKKEEREKAKAEKEAAKNKPPEWVEQLNEKGEKELVDKNKFPFEISCSVCGSIRYVNRSSLLLVDKCKLHARRERRKRRQEKLRMKAKGYKTIVKDAMAQKLFPESFMKKHGLNK